MDGNTKCDDTIIAVPMKAMEDKTVEGMQGTESTVTTAAAEVPEDNQIGNV